MIKRKSIKDVEPFRLDARGLPIDVKVSRDDFIRAIYADCTDGAVCIASPLASGAWLMREWRPGQDFGPSPYVCISTVNRGVPSIDVPETPETRRDYERGILRKRSTDCIETAVIMLDDIVPQGTSAIGGKIPAERILLAPIYAMETSPGNFQIGYRLRKPAAPREAAGLIEALRRAGLTDKGAGGVNRVMRVPGSVNTKPGRDGWKSVVRDWHPERTFTIQEIAEAFDITPVYGFGTREIPPAAETDVVLEKMAEMGLVDSTTANADGWWFIRCPFATEHTDGRDDAKYKPAPLGAGIFKCFHTACQERHVRQLIAYLIEQDPALRDALRIPVPFTAVQE
jgi:hypothetical protein